MRFHNLSLMGSGVVHPVGIRSARNLSSALTAGIRGDETLPADLLPSNTRKISVFRNRIYDSNNKNSAKVTEMQTKRIPINHSLVISIIVCLLIGVLILHMSGEALAVDEIECRYKGEWGGRFYDVTSDGDYLYTAHQLGVSVYDISDHEQPNEIGYVHTEGNAWRIEIQGDYAYVADGSVGLVIIDISDPGEPVIIGQYITDGGGSDVAVDQDHAYIADNSNGLLIFDITDKSDPLQIGLFNDVSNVEAVAVEGSFAYIVERDNGLFILNITDKNDPTELGNCRVGGSWGEDVFIQGNYAYVANGGDGMVIMNITDKENPTKMGRFDPDDWSYGVTVVGDHAYLPNLNNGLFIVDITDKDNPTEVGRIEETDRATQVEIRGDTLFLADDWNGLAVLDISNLSQPRVIYSQGTLYSVRDMALFGDYALVCDNYANLLILDVSDSSVPFVVGKCINISDPMEIEIQGDYAFIAADENGLYIVDISDVTDPRLVSQYDIKDETNDVAVQGNYAYIIHGDEGMTILDISNPANPLKKGDYSPDDFFMSLDVEGNYAYIAASYDGLIIVNVANKNYPSRAGQYDVVEEEYFFDAVVDGDYVYLGGSPGMYVMDVQQKYNPKKVGEYLSPRPIEYLCIMNDLLLTGDWEFGLMLMNVSDKEDPRQIGIYDTDGTPRGIVASENLIYTSVRNQGLKIVEMAPVARIQRISPNAALVGDEILFRGIGTDNGNITRFEWGSSIDGPLYGGTDTEFTRDDLTPGHHSISLKVRDDFNLWSREFIAFLNITYKPEASIESMEPDPALDGEVVTFTGLATDDNLVVRYLWSSSMDGIFYDGNQSSFTYDSLSNGTHTITFRVQDNHDFWSDDFTTALMINGRPRGMIDTVTPDPALTIDTVSFFGSGSDDGEISGYQWESDIDGELSTSQSFQMSGLSRGEHNITFRVVDDRGIWSLPVHFMLIVHEKPIVTVFSVTPNPALTTDILTFRGSGSDDGTILEERWKILNGSGIEYYSGSTPPSQLPMDQYTVNFSVKDNFGVWSNYSIEDIIVHERPVALIDHVSVHIAVLDESILFIGNGTDDGQIIRFSWNSSLDGEFFNGTDPSFSWSQLSAGNHTVALRVLDDLGAWSFPVFTTILVHNVPTANIEQLTPSPALEGETIHFIGLGTDDGSVIRFQWDSSIDGIMYDGIGSSFIRANLSMGDHIITLRVQDDHGIWSQEATENIIVQRRLKVGLPVMDPSPAKHGDKIRFTVDPEDNDAAVRIVWSSSLDGLFYNGTELSFTASNLSAGIHILRVRVQDDHGVWSDEVSTTLEVTSKEEGEDHFLANTLGPFPVFIFLILGLLAVIGGMGFIMWKGSHSQGSQDRQSVSENRD